jgi:LPS sulfotransferase NodH
MMVVNRFTRIVKKGCMEKAAALVKAQIERSGHAHAWRICTPYAARWDTMIIDMEFEDVGELDQFWTAWFADPGAATFSEEFDKLTLPGGASEIWNLAE